MKKVIQPISLLLLLFFAAGNLIKAQSKPGYQLPTYQKFKLHNGLTVYLMEKHEVPVISIVAVIPAGAVFDYTKAGVSSLTANCLKCGTKGFTKNQIEQQFDFVGASLNMYSTAEIAQLSAKFAVKDENKILPVFKELLVNPVFTNDEFNKEKKRTIVSLDQAKESPGSVINSYFNKFYYGKHIYGNVVSGTVSSVTPLSSDDAKSFHQKYYNPEGSAIAVVGDFSSAQMKSTITKLFNGWKNSGTAVTSLASQKIIAPLSARVLLINKDDASETTLLIGGAGVTRNNPDYIPVQVVNTFFGGRFTSWINDELRVKSGLTYGAGSYFPYNKNDGTFLISTHTANATTKPTIDKALEVINRLHTQTIDDQTLTSAKNYMIGLFPPRYQTTDQLAGLLTSMFWYGYDESYINNFEANVKAVTADKVKEVINKYFPKDKLQFVLIGKSADIKKIAESYGAVTEVQIKSDIGKGL